MSGVGEDAPDGPLAGLDEAWLERFAEGDALFESRYAQFSLADMRADLAGGQARFEAFVPWIEAAARVEVACAIGARTTTSSAPASGSAT